MFIDLRWLIVALCNLILYCILQLINTTLSPYAVHLEVSAIYLIAPLFLLSLRSGLIAVGFQGLLIDAAIGHHPFGYSLIIFSISLVILHYFKRLLKRANPLQLVMAVILINSLHLILQSSYYIEMTHLGISYWTRVLIDIIFSSIALFFITNRFVDMQRILIWRFGLDVASE